MCYNKAIDHAVGWICFQGDGGVPGPDGKTVSIYLYITSNWLLGHFTLVVCGSFQHWLWKCWKRETTFSMSPEVLTECLLSNHMAECRMPQYTLMYITLTEHKRLIPPGESVIRHSKCYQKPASSLVWHQKCPPRCMVDRSVNKPTQWTPATVHLHCWTLGLLCVSRARRGLLESLELQGHRFVFFPSSGLFIGAFSL